MEFEIEPVAQHWQMFNDVAAPVRAATSTLSQADVARLKDTIASAVGPYMAEGGRLRLAATPLCASGRR